MIMSMGYVALDLNKNTHRMQLFRDLLPSHILCMLEFYKAYNIRSYIMNVSCGLLEVEWYTTIIMIWHIVVYINSV